MTTLAYLIEDVKESALNAHELVKDITPADIRGDNHVPDLENARHSAKDLVNQLDDLIAMNIELQENA